MVRYSDTDISDDDDLLLSIFTYGIVVLAMVGGRYYLGNHKYFEEIEHVCVFIKESDNTLDIIKSVLNLGHHKINPLTCCNWW